MPHTAEKEHVAKIKPGITNPSPKYQNSMEKLTKNPHRQSIEKDETKLPPPLPPKPESHRSPNRPAKSKFPSNSPFGKKRGKCLLHLYFGRRARLCIAFGEHFCGFSQTKDRFLDCTIAPLRVYPTGTLYVCRKAQKQGCGRSVKAKDGKPLNADL